MSLVKSKKVTELKETKCKNQFRYIIARKIGVIFRVESHELII